MSKPPYSADARANGRPLELELDELQHHEDWALAAEIPLAQHALVLMQLVAWEQIPCGSLPADENILRAMCRIPADHWSAMRDVLMRGWWPADDGRLYHDALVPRVQEMLFKRSQETRRNQAWRAGKSSGTQVQRVANAVQVPHTHVRDVLKPPPLSTASTSRDVSGVPAGSTIRIIPAQVAFAMSRAGLRQIEPSDPTLKALIERGATVNDFCEAAKKAVSAGEGFRDALAAVEQELKESAGRTGRVRTQPPPGVWLGQPIEHPRNILAVEPPDVHQTDSR